MSFWLIVYLFTAEGEFIAKDVYETASKEQCEQFAGEVVRTIINNPIQAQFHFTKTLMVLLVYKMAQFMSMDVLNLEQQ